MIKNNKEWTLELEISEGFEIRVKDAYSCIINGDFDEDDLVYQVIERFKPEEVYVNDELDIWAKENGYVKQEDE